MYNNLEKQTSIDYYIKLSTKTNNKHKHTNSYLPTKLKKNKKIFFQYIIIIIILMESL